MNQKMPATPNSVPPRKKRLLLDVTIAATTDLNTGIQRVVRNIARLALDSTLELDYECQPFVCHGNQLSAVGFDGRARWDERIYGLTAKCWMGIHKGLARALSGIRKNTGEKYLAFLSRLRKLFVPKTLVRGVTNFYRKWTGRAIEIQEQDVLVLLDASWDLPLEEIFTQASAKNIPVVTVVYDLIPVLYPEFHQEQLKAVFSRWLTRVVERSDMMIGISETVREDAKEYWQKSPARNHSCVFESFRLGSDFRTKTNQPLELSTRLKQRLRSTEEFYLAVGTIEPRKNHELLLDAFDELWQNGSKSNLVIAGKVGWMCEEIARRIQDHPLLNKHLFHFDDTTDDELAGLYLRSKALLFPSFVEGFGLPIVEAFQFGTPVLASDTRIHREVAAENAIYFDPCSSVELANKILSIDSGKIKLRQPRFKVNSWSESCSEFFQKIDSFLKSAETNETKMRNGSSITSNQKVA